ncbi:MAG: metallophosphoesterase [Planctomycetes bacterium]|nr:metallophosphoesterase [Planctomycetota bacterium]
MDSQTDLTKSEQVTALFESAARVMRSSCQRSGSIIKLPAHGRLLVTGDLHDNPIHLKKIVHLAKLDASKDNHVVLHEIIHSERLVNKVDLSHRMLARSAELIIMYPKQVHVVLANHELSQMMGKGVSKGAGNSVELFDDGLAFVFGDDWKCVADSINNFIAAMPLAIKSESGLLCAHSLPAARTYKQFDPGILDRELTEDDYQSRTGSAYLMVWGRGHEQDQLDDLAKRWGVKLFCLGHEFVETGILLKDDHMFILNSDHEGAAVLPVDLACLPSAEEAAYSAIRLASVPL